MSRLPSLLGMVFALGSSACASPTAHADDPIALVLEGSVTAPRSRFAIVNRTTDALELRTYDGGNLHNDVERFVNGAWTDVSMGYCGMGIDDPVTIAAGDRLTVRAYVPSEAGRYRIRVSLDRRLANGTTSPVEVESAPFVVR